MIKKKIFVVFAHSTTLYYFTVDLWLILLIAQFCVCFDINKLYVFPQIDSLICCFFVVKRLILN